MKPQHIQTDLPVYTSCTQVPCRLMSKTALNRMGFTPGPIAAYIESGTRCYTLYDLAQAKKRITYSKRQAAIKQAVYTQRTCKRCGRRQPQSSDLYGDGKWCWTCIIDDTQPRTRKLTEADIYMRALLREHRQNHVVTDARLYDAIVQRVGSVRTRVYDAPAIEGRIYSGTWVCLNCEHDNFSQFSWCLNCGDRTIEFEPFAPTPNTDKRYAIGQTPILDAILTVHKCIGAGALLSLTEQHDRRTYAHYARDVRLDRIQMSMWFVSKLADELATIGEFRRPNVWAKQTLGADLFYSLPPKLPATEVVFIGSRLAAGKAYWKFD